MLYNQDYVDDAKKAFMEGEKLFQELDAESRSAEPELAEQRSILARAFGVTVA